MANPIARRLRKTMTPQEVKLWVHLRSWRSPRQDYIVDFVCMKYRLVIEVDGGQHNFDRQGASDRRRDTKLASQGFYVLRFWNSDVDHNLTGVLESIASVLTERSPHPAACGGHPPPTGEG